MQRQLVKHNEQLAADELTFLVSKDEKETRNFFRVMRILMMLCFIIPFIVAWFRAMDGAENPFSYLYYFLGVAFLLLFTFVCGYIAYSRTLKKIKADIRDRSKTIEQAHITRKQFMPHNNTYYFYLDSPNKLSIEVTASDFHALNTGDEVNIEYSTNARLYLGYF